MNIANLLFAHFIIQVLLKYTQKHEIGKIPYDKLERELPHTCATCHLWKGTKFLLIIVIQEISILKDDELFLKQCSFIETASSLKARWNPVNGKVQSSTSWVFECTLDYNDSVIWYKHVKDITMKLGYNEVIYPNLAGGILKADKKSEDKIVNTWSLLLVG
ncbi:hypothetical protein HELRODRAFT_158723 [Helobdella robusta]|uniref:Uncharacterized protein n=1 Tax=Helobdella robusta TaxID=6412 RepID=T1EN57_HELRO|nr:hypothetical protein HELRODRAFT_158723 [Helobdella robusta]ESO12247.1 hypothetical protein HELRODRAFT_158723 [Helobdella robusta]